ncbi:MAG TPA: hypothetical protein VFS27_12895 [Blastocatellia bacterium]|nr:hypothetical protein [Blastocatellia bacterium]
MIRSRDPGLEFIWRQSDQSGKTACIDGGILNLDAAFILALREIQMGEAMAPEPALVVDSDSPSTGSSGATSDRGGGPENSKEDNSKEDDSEEDSGKEEEKSKLKAPPNDPQDRRPDFFRLAPDQYQVESRRKNGFDWNAAFRQSMIFLAIEHAFRLATEEGTRAELKGPFFKDYFKAVRSLRGWDDGDPFLVNYIGHPMQGSVAGFIQIHNDPKGANEKVSLNKSYWRSRLKAFGWSFAYSTQFELGLFSEAAIGNVGMRSYAKSKHPMAYVDLVVTPVVGTGWLVGEDMLDRYLVWPLEDKIGNRVAGLLIRSFLNPTRSFANILRGQRPWYRDNR